MTSLSPHLNIKNKKKRECSSVVEHSWALSFKVFPFLKIDFTFIMFGKYYCFVRIVLPFLQIGDFGQKTQSDLREIIPPVCVRAGHSHHAEAINKTRFSSI